MLPEELARFMVREGLIRRMTRKEERESILTLLEE